jgi:hypothetical protein
LRGPAAGIVHISSGLLDPAFDPVFHFIFPEHGFALEPVHRIIRRFEGGAAVGRSGSDKDVIDGTGLVRYCIEVIDPLPDLDLD